VSGSRAELVRVAERYFAAVKARDVEGIRRVFGREAELLTVAGTYRGSDEIARFYGDLVFGASELDPRPGEFLVDGDRLAVEIELRLDGNVSRVADVFTIRDGLIERLGIYNGASVPEESRT
jgi:hypothetical protein